MCEPIIINGCNWMKEFRECADRVYELANSQKILYI